MILSFTSDKWCAQALHTDPENTERFYHVILWVLAESIKNAEDGAWFVIHAMCKGRLHYIRAEPEVAQQAKMFQGYARFSYAREAGERIYDEPEENWQLSLAP